MTARTDAFARDTRWTRAAGLHEGSVRGRRYVFNPAGHDSLTLLTARAARLLDAADGRALDAIAASTGDAVEALEGELATLHARGIVTSDAVPLPPRAEEKRFNVWVHVTNACNLDCPYCYIEKDAHGLSEDTARALRDSLVATARSGAVERIHLRFAGGEPMLRFAFVRRFFDETRDALAREGATLTAAIITNGTVVPDDAAAWMVANNVSVSISLDGVGEAQDAMRPAVGGGGSFARVIAGIERLVAGGVSPYMLATVAAANLDQMPSLTDFFLDRALGFRYSLVRDLDGGAALLDHRGAGWSERSSVVSLRRAPNVTAARAPMLEGEALARVQAVFAECYARVARRMPVAPSFRRTHRFCDLELTRPIARACGAGERYVAVSDRGRVSPCHAALHEEGARPLAAGASLVEVAPSLTQLGDFRRRAPVDECARCAWKNSCAGGCPLLLFRRDGHVDGRSPYCEVFRFVIPRILELGALEALLEEGVTS
ncbi:MAG: radical SAM protein [Polyangiales bacterium]